MKKLFDAKGEIPVIKKDAINPFFKAGYATLSIIIEVVEPILRKHGLFITHAMDGNTLETTIWDGDKALITSKFTLPANGDIQKIGSAITYAKRYNIVALLNLNIEDDDDGNSVKPQPKPEPKSFKPSDYCKDIEAKLLTAETKTSLDEITSKIKSDKKLTELDKDYLRNVYLTKLKEVK